LIRLILCTIEANDYKGRCNYGVDIFQIQQLDSFLLEVKTITKIAGKWIAESVKP
jgi:hypothetical protein